MNGFKVFKYSSFQVKTIIKYKYDKYITKHNFSNIMNL
jgi:hypothetical protein